MDFIPLTYYLSYYSIRFISLNSSTVKLKVILLHTVPFFPTAQRVVVMLLVTTGVKNIVFFPVSDFKEVVFIPDPMIDLPLVFTGAVSSGSDVHKVNER